MGILRSVVFCSHKCNYGSNEVSTCCNMVCQPSHVVIKETFRLLSWYKKISYSNLLDS
ncbi:LOW QUALITY PROTEIN: hypothetical protein PanWU01x14_076480 [Parasponia andersonii]|uniref:Uncharacterized protein n=1 Tax=Parasponia andersonii TaxID=3476 RepID=A0A2P5DCC1_PARAD|nr:LOW QUALITY PROTEIN: hypothetical protein PanWU01x14_076480 [Parasponia andersonii]